MLQKRSTWDCCTSAGCRAVVVMDGDLYDEFGNYIGPELESDESEGEEEREEEKVSGGRGCVGGASV